MGLFNKAVDVVGKGVSIIDQTVIDQDKAMELKADLIKSLGTLMLSGKGASVTKVTICILVGFIVLVGGYVFLFAPQHIKNFKDYALSVTPLIGILIGSYATGTTFQRIQKK